MRQEMPVYTRTFEAAQGGSFSAAVEPVGAAI
jgi:hypothetical protein